MKKHLLLLLIAISTVNCFAQITFEQGYYINNSGQMINGLIKNNDWRSNPEEFEFKLSESDDSQTLRIENVREFGVDDKFKFIRETVQIDRSSDNISNLSESRKPVFDTEELFLKVLVDGKADLYQYQNGNLKRYFFRIGDSEIEQLIYKNYRTSKGKIGTNNRFRQQLWNGLECETIDKITIEKTDYSENDLVKFFVRFNKCENADLVNFAKNKKSDLFNFNIRPRLTSSSLTVQSISNNREIELGNKQSIGVGVEAEFILPFNRNKWAVSLEPTYQNYISETTTSVQNVSGGTLTTRIDYTSIEVPLSIRHYFYFDKNSRIFANFSYVFDFSSDATIDFFRADGSEFNELALETQNNFAFGIGYKYGGRYSLELRYQTPREIIGNYMYWNSDFDSFSVILGYTLF